MTAPSAAGSAGSVVVVVVVVVAAVVVVVEVVEVVDVVVAGEVVDVVVSAVVGSVVVGGSVVVADPVSVVVEGAAAGWAGAGVGSDEHADAATRAKSPITAVAAMRMHTP